MARFLLGALAAVLLTTTSVSAQDCSAYTAFVVLDGSQSITATNFQLVRDATKTFVTNSISQNSEVRIGVLIYSDEVETIIPASSDAASINSQIDAAPYPSSGTRTDLAILQARQLIIEDPFTYPKVMIVITDGVSNLPTATADAARQAKELQITMIAVGIDEVIQNFPVIVQRFEDELLTIATSPELAYLNGSFVGLANRVSGIISTVCATIISIGSPLPNITTLVGTTPVFWTTISQSNIQNATWNRGGALLNGQSGYNIAFSEFNHTLSIPNVQLSQAGEHTFAIGSASTSGFLTVLGLIPSQSVEAGTTVTLETSVSPSTNGVWTRNGIPIQNSAKYTIQTTGERRLLIIRNAQTSDIGPYTFTVNGVPTTGFLTVTETAVDGGYTEWTQWSTVACPVTCGLSATKTESRSRSCTNPVPSNGGRQCDPPSFETRVVPCNLGVNCPVNGVISNWEQWGQAVCPVTCGFSNDGVQTRVRFCNNPPPSDGGAQCSESLTETRNRPCNLSPCAVDGGFSEWLQWEAPICPLTCGGTVPGTSTRVRFCNAPAPSNGGQDCVGSNTDTRAGFCTVQNCAVDGNWGQWTPWDRTCFATCGAFVTGRQTRTRLCDSPPPSNGGISCPGLGQEVEQTTCTLSLCPVDGGLSQWSPWLDNCDQTCGSGGGGSSIRSRTCTNPAPQNGGAQCVGELNEFRTPECSFNPCPVDGNWSPWQAWSERCGVSCGFNIQGSRSRMRDCNNPAPVGAGAFCRGESFAIETFICSLPQCAVDGAFSPWTAWVSQGCPVTCGTGVEPFTRERQCNSPAPMFGGLNCTGSYTDEKSEFCTRFPCPIDGGYTPWTQWDNPACSVTCGAGVQNPSRTRTCTNPVPQNGGRNCDAIGPATETFSRICVQSSCPVDGGEGPWTQWQTVIPCNGTCGLDVFFQRTRARQCNSPTPANGGAFCVNPLSETGLVNCGFDNCPIDGGVSEWTQWSQPNCSQWTCGVRSGPVFRTRTCTNPVPQFGGQFCLQALDETSTRPCNLGNCPIDGGFSVWTPWAPLADCSRTCGGGTRQFRAERQCNNPTPQFGGLPCQGIFVNITTRDCNTQPCSIDGNWSPWAQWTYEGPCDRTCGTGSARWSRARTCTNPPPAFNGATCPGTGIEFEPRPCNDRNCPVDGGFTPWAQWVLTSTCSVTCGGGQEQYRRSRTCTNPVPRDGGANCVGSSTDFETRTCNSNNCPIDGVYSDWTPWVSSGCNVTCGGGGERRTRSRFCNNPAPQFNGANCVGPAADTEILPCGNNNCPIDGVYSPWTQWLPIGGCSVTCGSGNQLYGRNRLCNNPAPQFGGRDCVGVATQNEQRACIQGNCPINGAYTLWAQWTTSGPCNVTCGGGLQPWTRTRTCTNPAPQFGGLSCFGVPSETTQRSCNPNPCPIDGVFNFWTQWVVTIPCTQSCAGGTETYARTRQCNNPAPQFGGRNCTGAYDDVDVRSCNPGACPIDGGFGPWAPWDNPPCPVTCGGGTREFTAARQCNSPVPQFNGRPCSGQFTKTEIRNCSENPCPIDGVFGLWTQWGFVTPCSVSCGQGIRNEVRDRLCDSPPPQNGGRNCFGDGTEARTRTCNDGQCPIDGGYGPWAPWDNPACPVTCGGGVRTLRSSRQCNSPTPAFGGAPCNGVNVTTTIRVCGDNLCPVNGGYNEWTPWTPSALCSVTCGRGSRPYTRNRQCNNPTPANGGLPCSGAAFGTETRVCNDFNCPINGAYSPWEEWATLTGCSVTCGGGRQTFTRRRVCDNPAPQFNGLPCQESSSEVITRSCSIGGCPVDGAYSPWTQWASTGPCSDTCNTGTEPFSRNRVCNDPAPVNGGLPCQGPSVDATFRDCNTNPCPIDGGFSPWGPWDNPPCNVTCGGGLLLRERSRQCNNPLPMFGGASCVGPTAMSETRTCSNNLCPIDGGLSPWTNWTATTDCPVTCGGGERTFTRTRVCNNPVPLNGGRPCTGTTFATQTRSCNPDNCPIDGGIGPWSPWVETGCQPTCGTGVTNFRYRNRNCSSPIPQFGGAPCSETRFESQNLPCNNPNCPIDGNWVDWTAWSTPVCAVTCGVNISTNVIRTRTCTNPAPDNGGVTCPGEGFGSTTRFCDLSPCPIDGAPGPWTEWAIPACSVTCGSGSHIVTRSRTCTNPAPRFGGQNCTQQFFAMEDNEPRACTESNCPVNGIFTQWSNWLTVPCPETCGRGARTNQTRERTCIQPSFGGLPCQGDIAQNRVVSCNLTNCPIDGQMTPWSPWIPNACSATCGPGTLQRRRTRTCTNPAPQFGGLACQESVLDTETQACFIRVCPTDGGFGPWGPWDNPVCPVTCGGGQRGLRRARQCNNPTPSFDGRPCQGSYTDTETRTCNTDPCPIDGQFSPWTQWFVPACPVTCGSGISVVANRSRVCNNPIPQFGGQPCTGTTEEREGRLCFLPGCPVDGNWSPWSAPTQTPCSRTCGPEATRFVLRTRQCNQPTPRNGGQFCPGQGLDWQTVNCNLGGCPIDGNWAPWTEWSVTPCSRTCGNQSTSAIRTRTCTDPPPSNGGASCAGEPTQFRTQDCRLPPCAVDGAPGPWGPWSTRVCTRTCGNNVLAFVFRERNCTNPPPSNGGVFCPQPLYESRYDDCNVTACPVDGNWAAWTPWSNPTCTETCGLNVTGPVIRFRQCSNPAPSNGGAFCIGEGTESSRSPCDVPQCQVNGEWGVWQPWNDPACPRTCGGNIRTLTRVRRCDNPAPQFGGVTCPGLGSGSETRTCGMNDCPSDGQWSQWTAWSVPRCSVTCGPDLTAPVTRTRACNSPAPSSGGRSCPGENTEFDTRSCGLPFCPIDGNWSPWTNWDTPPCPVTCGGATITRTRIKTCTNPIPQFLGQFCPGDPEESQTLTCSANPCPIDGVWTEWGPWTDPASVPCPVTCGISAMKNIPRIRTCTNPAPSNGGQPCDGTGIDFYELNCGLNPCPGADICARAVNLGGVGYVDHPEDCYRYIQCYFNTSAPVPPSTAVVAVYRTCPFGYYWNQAILRCDHSWKVPCNREKCGPGNCDTTYDMDGSCRAYWACEDGISIGQCCENEHRFVAGRGCMPDPLCTDPCPVPCLRSIDACDKRPEWTNLQAFNVRAGSIGWLPSTCTSNQVYDIVTCTCEATQNPCFPQPSTQFATLPAGVTTNAQQIGGTVRFNSPDHRVIFPNRLGAAGGPSTLQFTYREQFTTTQQQILMESKECMDCDNATTIRVSITQNELLVRVQVWTGAVVNIPLSTQGFNSGQTKIVTIIYRNEIANSDQALLTVVLRVDSYEYIHEEYAPRGLDLYRCGLVFGAEDSADQSFRGQLNSMAFFNCERRDLYQHP